MEHRNQEELERIHNELSELEQENILAMQKSLTARIRYKHQLAKATLSWPASKAESVVIDEHPEEWEEYYTVYYNAPIAEEKVKAKRREYYHARWSSETNTMIDIQASRLWEWYN
jgi:hypothetical protein